MDNNEVRKKIRKRHNRTTMFLILTISSCFLAVLLILVMFYMFKDNRHQELLIICFSMFFLLLILVILTIIIWTKIQKDGGKQQLIKPYQINLQSKFPQELTDVLLDCMKMERLEESIFSTYSDVLCLLFEMDSFEMKSYMQLRKRMIHKAKSKYKMTGDFHRLSGIYDNNTICLVLVHSITEEITKKLWNNASYSMRSNPKLDVFVDRNTWSILIPAYSGWHYAESARYIVCIEYLLRMIDKINNSQSILK